jgi:hypothetical protein
MEGIKFSRNEVQELAARLATLQLSPEDQELLLAIFSAASSQVIEYPEGGRAPGDLQDQLVNAFIPGAAPEFAIFARVGPTPISPMTPPRVGPAVMQPPNEPQAP